MGNFVPVAKLSQMKEGEGVIVLASDEEIALFTVAGKVYACTNVCPHRGGPIGEGALEGKVVTCPWHGWEFDVTTGAMPVNPRIGLKTFPVVVEGDDVKIELEAARG